MTIQEESNESDEDSESLASSSKETRHQKDDHQGGLSTDAESHRRNRSKQSTRSRLENGNLLSQADYEEARLPESISFQLLPCLTSREEIWAHALKVEQAILHYAKQEHLRENELECTKARKASNQDASTGGTNITTKRKRHLLRPKIRTFSDSQEDEKDKGSNCTVLDISRNAICAGPPPTHKMKESTPSATLAHVHDNTCF